MHTWLCREQYLYLTNLQSVMCKCFEIIFAALLLHLPMCIVLMIIRGALAWMSVKVKGHVRIQICEIRGTTQTARSHAIMMDLT